MKSTTLLDIIQLLNTINLTAEQQTLLTSFNNILLKIQDLTLEEFEIFIKNKSFQNILIKRLLTFESMTNNERVVQWQLLTKDNNFAEKDWCNAAKQITHSKTQPKTKINALEKISKHFDINEESPLVLKLNTLKTLDIETRKTEFILLEESFNAKDWQIAAKTLTQSSRKPSSKSVAIKQIKHFLEISDQKENNISSSLLDEIYKVEQLLTIEEIKTAFNQLSANKNYSATDWKNAGKSYQGTSFTSAKKAKESILVALEQFRANVIGNLEV